MISKLLEKDKRSMVYSGVDPRCNNKKIDHCEGETCPAVKMHAIILCVDLGPIVHKARSGVYYSLACGLATAA